MDHLFPFCRLLLPLGLRHLFLLFNAERPLHSRVAPASYLRTGVAPRRQRKRGAFCDARCIIIAKRHGILGPGVIQARNPPLSVQTPPSPSHRRADIYADSCQDLSALVHHRCCGRRRALSPSLHTRGRGRFISTRTATY